MTRIFELESVSKVYSLGASTVHALREVDFELDEAEFLVLLGPSGSGKSTLLNILGGLDVPSSGRVRFRDQDLSGAASHVLTEFRRHHVGFVFQFYNLIPSLTAEENVEVVTDIAANPMSPADALDLVGLSDRRRHFPSQLSGGEQQRVGGGRAIAKRPEVLLCDEPTGALDVETGKLILSALRRLNEELGTAVAVITHNAAIGDIGTRVVRLRDGSIASSETNAAPAEPESVTW